MKQRRRDESEGRGPTRASESVNEHSTAKKGRKEDGNGYGRSQKEIELPVGRGEGAKGWGEATQLHSFRYMCTHAYGTCTYIGLLHIGLASRIEY